VVCEVNRKDGDLLTRRGVFKTYNINYDSAKSLPARPVLTNRMGSPSCRSLSIVNLLVHV